MFKTIITIVALIIACVALALTAFPKASATTHPYYDNDQFIPSYIYVGPDSTQFQVIDNSRGRAIRYYCAFTQMKEVHRILVGLKDEYYIPTVRCNTYTPDSPYR